MPNLKHLKDDAGQLHALFSSITASFIAEPLQSCCETDDAPLVKSRMEELDFDVYGLQDADGVVRAYVQRVDLAQGRCGQYRTPFQVADLVAASTSLIRILQILRDQPRIFVLTDNRVTGIITRGDLQKTPVRIYLSGLFSLLEMQLLRLVSEYYPGNSWEEKLEPGRLGKAERLWDLYQTRNEAGDLLECIMLGDKLALAWKHENLRKRLGLADIANPKEWRQSIEGLRNRVDHGKDLVFRPTTLGVPSRVRGTSWHEVIDLVEEVDNLVRSAEQIE